MLLIRFKSQFFFLIPDIADKENGGTSLVYVIYIIFKKIYS